MSESDSPVGARAGEVEVVPGVLVDPGMTVRIVDAEGEVVVWTYDEWSDDSESVTAAVCASVIAALMGPSAVRKNIEKQGAVLADLIEKTARLSDEK